MFSTQRTAECLNPRPHTVRSTQHDSHVTLGGINPFVQRTTGEQQVRVTIHPSLKLFFLIGYLVVIDGRVIRVLVFQEHPVQVINRFVEQKYLVVSVFGK